MCGRFSLTVQKEAIGERFDCEVEKIVFLPRFNIAPSQEIPVIVRSDRNYLRTMRWGLIPSWAHDAIVGYKMINARAETLMEKDAFREAFEHRRCIVATDGFYEWRQDPLGDTRSPFYFTQTGGGLFGMAGLWDFWTHPEQGNIYSFTIITTEPNETVACVHNRMPAVLAKDHEAMWLDSRISDSGQLQPLLKPCSPDRLCPREVSGYVNSPAHEGPACVEPTREKKKTSRELYLFEGF